MELFVNETAPLTRWLVRERLLPTPFVLVDVGVQGGIGTRWSALADQIHVYGFDPLEEAMAPLRVQSAPNHHFFTMALGSDDGERTLHVQSNRFASSFYAQAPSRFDVDKGVWREEDQRQVPVRRLDSLFAEGLVAPADFIKLDCEGFEPEVLKGATRYLEASDLIGADLETNFNVSPTLPETHFWESYQPFLHKRLQVFDAAISRLPRSLYADHIAVHPRTEAMESRHRPATWNMLLARDLIQDCESPSSFPWMPNVLVDADAVLKSIIVLELYGLIDCAYEYLINFRKLLAPHLDVGKALNILLDDVGRTKERVTSSTGAIIFKRLVKGMRDPHAALRRLLLGGG
jgi:FkbM family methyltransferase